MEDSSVGSAGNSAADSPGAETAGGGNETPTTPSSSVADGHAADSPSPQSSTMTASHFPPGELQDVPPGFATASGGRSFVRAIGEGDETRGGAGLNEKQKLALLKREYRKLRQTLDQQESESVRRFAEIEAERRRVEAQLKEETDQLSLRLGDRGKLLQSEHKRNVMLQDELARIREENALLRERNLSFEHEMRMKDRQLEEARSVADSVTQDWDADGQTDFGGKSYMSDGAPADKEGMLVRKKTTRGRQSLWFVLKENVLLFQRGPQARRPVGVLFLKDVVTVIPSREMRTVGRFPFKLIHRNSTYTIYAGSEDERESWIRAIRDRLDSLKHCQICTWHEDRELDEECSRAGFGFTEAFYTPDS